MSLSSLIYVSKSNLGDGGSRELVAAILRVSNANNAMHDLTGALVFTGTHFVQVLEGEKCALKVLMSKIDLDARHTSLVVVREGPLTVRRFADWSMAYVGPSIFVTRHIRRLLLNPLPAEADRAVDWLETFLVDSARVE